MKSSVEISMYPLDRNYETSIIQFIKKLRTYPFIIIETNGMSTQIFGEYDNVMHAVNTEMKSSFLNNEKVVFTLKVVNSDLKEKPSF
ncbi:MAG: hypothetical protein ISR00_01920 [Flavobacteriales bacterium]|nr:hypothetical protein [Flavobacteriales bacterium]MBL6872690.1 hypothetical protein [Flavobacteriales bacterium]